MSVPVIPGRAGKALVALGLVARVALAIHTIEVGVGRAEVMLIRVLTDSIDFEVPIDTFARHPIPVLVLGASRHGAALSIDPNIGRVAFTSASGWVEGAVGLLALNRRACVAEGLLVGAIAQTN